MTSLVQRRSATGTANPEVRTRLLDATVDLLRSGGPQSATSRVIASAAGENLAAITYYFGSKRELLSEAMALAARQLIQPVIDELTDDTKDGVSKLMSAVQQLYRVLADNENLLGPYLHALAAASTNATLATEVVTLHQDLVHLLTAEMTSQLDQDLLPDWVQPTPMAQLIVALVDGIAVNIAIDPNSTDPAGIGGQFTQLLLHARANPS